MLVLEWKERAFLEKVNSRCFCWFPAAILVHQNHIGHIGAPIWRLHTKLYKGAWNVSANNSETVGHKHLRLGQTVYILVFYNISLHFFHWKVSNLFFGAEQWERSIIRKTNNFIFSSNYFVCWISIHCWLRWTSQCKFSQFSPLNSTYFGILKNN